MKAPPLDSFVLQGWEFTMMETHFRDPVQK